MIVKVDIPPRDLWALSNRAEREGVTVGDLLIAAATAEHYTPSTTETTHDRVSQLWHQGMCDADIAGELHLTTNWVKEVRLGLKLPANRRFKPTAEAARSAAYKQHRAEKRTA